MAILFGLPLFSGSAAADPFTGEFIGSLDGEIYQLTIHVFARGQYDGEYRVGDNRLPLNARRFGDRIAGQVGIDDLKFGFTAELRGNGLLMQRENAPAIVFRRNLPQAEND